VTGPPGDFETSRELVAMPVRDPRDLDHRGVRGSLVVRAVMPGVDVASEQNEGLRTV
jgi:hypothetical protein